MGWWMNSRQSLSLSSGKNSPPSPSFILRTKRGFGYGEGKIRQTYLRWISKPGFYILRIKLKGRKEWIWYRQSLRTTWTEFYMRLGQMTGGSDDGTFRFVGWQQRVDLMMSSENRPEGRRKDEGKSEDSYYTKKFVYCSTDKELVL